MEITPCHLLLSLLCVGWQHHVWGASDVTCEMTNDGGIIKTFFSSHKKINTFPCSYKLADFECNRRQTVVTAVNDVNRKGNTFFASVTVEVTFLNEYNIKVIQTNTVTADLVKEFAGNPTDPMWTYTLRGQHPLPSEVIRGFYNADRRIAYVQHEDLTVNFKPSQDRLTITCKTEAFGRPIRFPKTVCGSNTNTMDNVLALGRHLKGDKGLRVDLSSTLLDYAHLTEQDIHQENELCRDVSELVYDPCNSKAEKLYKCHMLYSPFERNMYGVCMRDKYINAFQVYALCVRLLCQSEGGATEEECRLLNKVSRDCGDKNNSPIKISELLRRGKCGK